MSYIIHLLTMLSIYIIILLGTNLLVGFTNLFSFAQGAFLGIGAYLGVWIFHFLGLPFPVSVFLVLVLTGLSSLIISLPSFRLKGDYFIIASIGFQSIVFSILYNCESITRGPLGISGLFLPDLFPGMANSNIYSGFLISIMLVSFTILITLLILHSPFGRILKGIREDETAVLVLGRNPIFFKVLISFISCGIMGLAGILYALYSGYIDPTIFTLELSIYIITSALIGGTGNVIGPICGAVFVTFVPEIIRLIGLPNSQVANIQQIIYGLLLIFLVRFRPQGIAGETRF